jgi:hypothetical protein
MPKVNTMLGTVTLASADAGLNWMIKVNGDATEYPLYENYFK